MRRASGCVEGAGADAGRAVGEAAARSDEEEVDGDVASVRILSDAADASSGAIVAAGTSGAIAPGSDGDADDSKADGGSGLARGSSGEGESGEDEGEGGEGSGLRDLEAEAARRRRSLELHATTHFHAAHDREASVLHGLLTCNPLEVFDACRSTARRGCSGVQGTWWYSWFAHAQRTGIVVLAHWYGTDYPFMTITILIVLVPLLWAHLLADVFEWKLLDQLEGVSIAVNVVSGMLGLMSYMATTPAVHSAALNGSAALNLVWFIVLWAFILGPYALLAARCVRDVAVSRDCGRAMHRMQRELECGAPLNEYQCELAASRLIDAQARRRRRDAQAAAAAKKAAKAAGAEGAGGADGAAAVAIADGSADKPGDGAGAAPAAAVDSEEAAARAIAAAMELAQSRARWPRSLEIAAHLADPADIASVLRQGYVSWLPVLSPPADVAAAQAQLAAAAAKAGAAKAADGVSGARTTDHALAAAASSALDGDQRKALAYSLSEHALAGAASESTLTRAESGRTDTVASDGGSSTSGISSGGSSDSDPADGLSPLHASATSGGKGAATASVAGSVRSLLGTLLASATRAAGAGASVAPAAGAAGGGGEGDRRPLVLVELRRLLELLMGQPPEPARFAGMPPRPAGLAASTAGGGAKGQHALPAAAASAAGRGGMLGAVRGSAGAGAATHLGGRPGRPFAHPSAVDLAAAAAPLARSRGLAALSPAGAVRASAGRDVALVAFSSASVATDISLPRVVGMQPGGTRTAAAAARPAATGAGADQELEAPQSGRRPMTRL
jgi:hypothetical protein